MMFRRACRHRLAAFVTGVRRVVRACLWARPVVGSHAAGAGGNVCGVARPALTRADRALLVFLVGRLRTWQQALLVVQPETLLRWHRAGFHAL